MTLIGDSTNHGFFWDNGTLTDVGSLAGDKNSEAWFTDDAGDVVGVSYSQYGEARAFLWKNGVITDLGVPTACSQPEFINSKGQVVVDTGCGYIGTPFLWENGVAYNLENLVLPGSDLTLLAVNSINDRGEIACAGLQANGNQHNCVMIPCDENHPGIEGCDYGLVESAASANVRPAQTTPKANLVPGPDKSSQAEIIAKYRQLLANRHRRFAGAANQQSIIH